MGYNPPEPARSPHPRLITRVTLSGLSPEVGAHKRLGVTKKRYRQICETIADQLGADDDTVPPHQRQGDLEQAEWMLAIFYAAGLKVTLDQSAPQWTPAHG